MRFLILDTPRQQPGVSPRIVGGRIADFMAVAVQLNGQESLGAIEVEDVGPYRVLAAKMIAAQLSTLQPHPQANFRARQRPAVGSRPLDADGVRPHVSTLGTHDNACSTAKRGSCHAVTEGALGKRRA